ncbi:hypothetical protein NL676_039864 [Syzygium grande]|nr:hypothetical protein NL676_039864 [Syzygium grande]
MSISDIPLQFHLVPGPYLSYLIQGSQLHHQNVVLLNDPGEGRLVVQWEIGNLGKESGLGFRSVGRVKNKTLAPIQITAEQILREAHERPEAEIRPLKQKITDHTLLGNYRLRKRKEFEDLIHRVQ